MNWFRKLKSSKPVTLDTNKELPLLRIFNLIKASVEETILLSQGISPINIAGFQTTKENKTATCIIPTLARDGHVSFVLAGTVDNYNKIQKSLSAQFINHINRLKLTHVDLARFCVFGFTLSFSQDPLNSILVYETSVYPVPIPELTEIYDRLGSIKGGLDTFELESYFSEETRKNWLNGFIENIEKSINWPEFVADSIKQYKNA
jgi:hypothetical protein